MDEDLDEFGNYIGEEYSDSNNSGNDSGWEDEIIDEGEDVIDEDAQLDTQDISEPLVKRRANYNPNTVMPSLWEFQFGIMIESPGLVRNLAVTGDLHHGKSSLFEWFLEGTLTEPLPSLRNKNQIETQRGITIFPRLASILLQNAQEKSYVFNIADTPGHPDFRMEKNSVLKICDGTVHVVDIIDGPITRPAKLPHVLVLNKLDRLILDQRLPPVQAFRRIKVVADEMNVELTNVVFMSTKFRLAFTLHSIERLYKKFQFRNNSGKSLDFSEESTFVKFILEPIYKLISCGLVGKESHTALQPLGVYLDEGEWDLGFDERIRLVLQRFFECGFEPLIDAIVTHIPPPDMNETNKETISATCVEEDASDINLSSYYYDQDKIFAVGKAERHNLKSVGDLWLPYGDKKIPVPFVPAGSWFVKSHEIEDHDIDDETCKMTTESIMKVEITPLKATNEDYKKLEDGVRIISIIFPAFGYSSGESGTIMTSGTGEMYLDTCLGFLRSLGHAFRTGVPTSEFHETVSSESYLALPTKTAGPSQSTIITIASPIETLDSKNPCIWYSTPSNSHLIGPTSSSHYPSPVLESIIEGFKWFVERGPLVEGTVRDTVMTITSLKLSDATHLLSTTVHRACCAALLLASPRLMEPVFRVTVIGGLAAGRACYSELAKREGSVVADEPIPGTSLYKTQGVVPVIDSLGLSVDIVCQMESNNLAKVTFSFESWKVVNGDPVDPLLKASRLKPAPSESRARDFLLKTRKAKGLSNEPQLTRFVDDDVRSLLD